MNKKIILSLVAYTMGYGDSAAALEVDGKIYGPIEEERFTRKRYESGLPINAIKYLLKLTKTKASDVNLILFHLKPNEKILTRLKLIISNFINALNDSSYPETYLKVLLMKRTLRKKLSIDAPIKYIPHHMCHAYYSFFSSGFKNSLVITLDGAGDGKTGNVCTFSEDGDIKELDNFLYPNSLGVFYSAISDYIGFPLPSGPGKVMGLSAYGDSQKFYSILKEMICVVDGKPELNLKYFEFHKNLVTPKSSVKKKWLSKYFEKQISIPRRLKNQELTQPYIDLAGGLQKLTTKIGSEIVEYWLKKSGEENICLSGGVALNAVMNEQIVKNLKGSFYVPPGCGDCGNTAGALLFNSIPNKSMPKLATNQQYTGPKYGTNFVKNEILKFKGILFDEYDLENVESRENYLRAVATSISEGNVIGWFHGQMEFGPRALGNRSILADPTNKIIKDIINSKVKHREWFRPFAPTVLDIDFNKFFETSYKDPYMLTTPLVREEWREILPAITHVDGTARVQNLKWSENNIYYELIEMFKSLKGYGILLNTSFNDNEPIVCSPYDAINCFIKTNIDLLAIEGIICKKKGN